jgi:predicted kinase
VRTLTDHYIAYRAFVRAKVACIRAAQGESASFAEAAELAALTLRHLEVGEVRLVLVGGAPGTGKTTLARALADNVGYVALSSDDVRQEQAFAAADRYTPAAKQSTYDELLARAGLMLAHGESVVLDATFGDTDSRRAAAHVAETTASRLVALECQAPVELAAARAERRRAGGHDASEADGELARSLAAGRDPWPHAVAIDTSRELSGELDRARAVVLGTAGPL